MGHHAEEREQLASDSIARNHDDRSQEVDA
jgi:hypothetical protein